MNKVGLIADSSCDLPLEIIGQYDIDIVPVSMYFPKETRTQYIDITTEEFFEKLVDEDLHCTTGVPPPKRYITAINSALSKNEQIIMLHLSKDLSGIWSSGVVHAKNIAPERITVVDVRTTTNAFGLVVLKVARLIKAGFSKEKILLILNKEIIPNIQLSAFVGTLKYLKRSGRIASLQHILGEIFKFKPLIIIEDGKLESPTKVRGEKASFKFLEKLGRKLTQVLPDNETLVVIHSRNISRAKELTNILRTLNKKRIEILTWEIGPAIGVHVGPGALGLTWVGKPTNELLEKRTKK